MIFTLLIPFVITYLLSTREPFQSFEGTVGYMVVERGGRVENYIVVEERDGSVRLVKVNRNPSKFLKKSEEVEDKK